MKKTDYSKIAGYYDRTRGGGGPLHRIGCGKIREFGSIDRCGRVLDIGCGTGNYLIDIARAAYERIDGRCGARPTRFVGIDSSREMLEKAVKKDAGKRIDWILCDAQRLPFKNESFGCAYMTFVIHHIENKEAALREIRRILEKSGTMIIMTSSHARFRRSLYRLFPGLLEIDYERFPKIPVLRRMVKNAGFVSAAYYSYRQTKKGMPVSRVLGNMRARFISTLSLMSDDEFRTGYDKFKERLALKYGKKINFTTEADFVVARK